MHEMTIKDRVSIAIDSKNNSLFKNPKGKLLVDPRDDGGFKILFRDDVMDTITADLAIIHDKKPRAVLVTGEPGTSKSWLLEIIHSSLKGRATKVAHVNCKETRTMQAFFSSIRNKVLAENYRSLSLIQRNLDLMAANDILIILADDLHELACSVSPGSFDEYFQHFKDNCISIIATSKFPISLNGDTSFWDDVLVMDPYDTDEIREILKYMVELNVVDGVLASDLPASVCAKYVITNLQGNVNHAIRIMEIAIKKVEREVLLARRDSKELKVDDVETAIKEFEKNDLIRDTRDVLMSRNVHFLLLAEVLASMGKASFPSLYTTYKAVHARLFPSAAVPSDRTVRDMLATIVDLGIAKTEKARSQGRGVRMTWICDQKQQGFASLLARSAIVKKVLDDMKVIDDDD